MPKKNNAIDMTKGNPTRLILSFSIPLLLGNIFQQMYNMVDSVVVGNFVGKNALSAVSIGFPVIFLLSSLFLGLGMGATIMIAQYIGAGEKEQVRKTVNTVYRGMMIVAIPLTILGILIAPPLLNLIKVPAGVHDYALSYTTIVFAGIIGNLGFNINTGIMQGLGDSKTPLIFLAIACVINIVLDLVFVAVFSMGVKGVALATIIAQACSWIFGIFYINKKYSYIHISFLKSPMERPLLRQVVRLGIPSGVQQCQFAVAIILMQALINSFGEDFTAGFAAANKIDSFAFMPIISFSTAVTTYVGQNMGAQRMDRVNQGLRSTLFLSVGTCLVTSTLVVIFGRQILYLFNQDPAVLDAGMGYLMRVIPPMFVLAVLFTLNSVLRGAGATMVPMISSILALWVARVPAAYIIAHFITPNTPENLYWSYLIGWLLGCGVTFVSFFRGRWRTGRVSLPIKE